MKKRVEWGVMVLFSDGTGRYYREPTARQGQADWSPRVNQARRFPSEQRAQSAIDHFSSNSSVEYRVVSLPKQR